MVIVCPNLSNKEVAMEFLELVDATSEQAAYHIWSMNNGYNIDTAPNGEPSILFQTLLDQFGGDRKKAIAEKAKTYSNSFVKWFGDWTLEDKSNVSEIVDENGEPFVVYHGGTVKDGSFDSSKAKTASGGFFFTADKNVAKGYGNVSLFYLNIKNPKEHNGEQFDGIGPVSDANEYDGEIYFHEGAEAFIVYDPTQISSIKRNFDINVDNIDDKVLSIWEKLRHKGFRNTKGGGSRSLGDHLRVRLMDSMGSTFSNMIGDIYDSCRSLQEFYDKLDFFMYNEFFQKTLPESVKRLLDFINSNHYINPNAYIKYWFDKMDEGVVTGNLEEDVKKLGRHNVQILSELFPKIYKQGFSRKLYGYYKHNYYKNKSLFDSVIDRRNVELFSANQKLNKLKNIQKAYNSIKDFRQRVISKVNSEVLNYYKNGEASDVVSDTYASMYETEDLEQKGFDPFLFNSIFPNGTNFEYDVKSIISRIIQLLPQLKPLLGKVLQQLEGNSKIIFARKASSVGGSTWTAFPDDRDQNGLNPTVIALNLDSDLLKYDTLRTVIHEIIHSLSSAYLRDKKNEEVRESLEQYLQYVHNIATRNIGSKDDDDNRKDFFGILSYEASLIYGLESVEEFIAEFFSNPSFLDWLKKIPAMEQTKFQSLFHLILDTILKILGITREDSAYDQIKPILEFVVDKTSSDYTMSTLQDVGVKITDVLEASNWNVLKNDVRSFEKLDGEILLIENGRRAHVESVVKKTQKESPDTTVEEMNDVVSDAEEEYNQNLSKSIVEKTKDCIIKAYGLTKKVDESGRVRYEGNDVVVEFVQYLEDELGEHEGWYDYNSLSNAAHNVIKIAMNGNSFATFKHELAHHYIRMFWGTPLIQNALGAVYKEGMTMQELEEALVDEMTSRTGVLFQDDVEQKTFYTKFWEKFSEMLAKAFNIKNNTYKEILLNNAAKAYVLNEQQKANPKYKEKFLMHNGRMYMDKYTKRKKEAREKKKQQAFKSHYQFTNSERRDQRVVKTIVDEAVRRKRSMQNYKDITDKEVVALNVFEQDVLEFVEALKLQREMEVQKLKAIGKSESYARRMSGDSSKELLMNVDIIGKFIDNAEKELGVAVNRFRSAKSAMFMKVTIKTEEDPTTGDINTTYVNASEYGVDPNVSQKDFSFEELSRLGRDLISYYTDIYSDINQMLENRTVNKLYTEEQLLLIKDRLETIKSLVDEVSALYKEGLYERCVQFVDQYVENYSKNHPGVLDEEHAERLKINFHKWIDGQFDLGMGSRFSVHYLAENWLGIAEWSQSPIIRMMHQIIFDNNSQNEEDVIKRKNELYAARERAKKSLMKKFNFKSLFTTFDKTFMEYDENGFPTGNFLSKVNKGKFYRKRSVFIDELLYSKGGIEDKIREVIGDPNYELDVNPNGMPIFPDDERCEKIEIEYLVKYNDFLSLNCERQYTPEYYKERLRILCNLDKDMLPTDDSSTKALHAQNEIQSEIDKILKPCIIKGRPHTELLEPDQIYALQLLENQRTLLSSPYDSYGRKRQEGTDEYYVYQRLKAWKDFLKDKNIVYEIDKESFEESLEKSKNKKQFRRLNTYRKIDSRFWDIFSDHLGRVEDAELEELLWQRTQLLSILKSRGLSKPNLDIVWDEVNGRIKPEWEEFFQNLKELDTKIKNRRITLSKGKKTSAKDAEFIDSMIDRRPALKDKDTWYQHMSEAIKKRHYSTKAPGAKTKAEEEIKRLLRYVDKNDKSHELSIFNVTYPKLARLKDSEGEFSTIVREPIRAYSIINVEKSDENWVNKNFDRESDEVIQPKISEYKDERYEKVLGDDAPKEVKEYYNLLKSTMRDAYANISFLGKYDDMLPQTCARASSILSRFSWRFWKSVPFIIKREFDVTENDTDINEVVFKQRKDNTITGAIPVRYIKRLDDPRFINGDLMRSVLLFYAMSKNYISMQSVAPIFTSLHEQMLKSGSDEQAKVAKGFIHRQVYGKTKTGIPDGVLTKTVKRLLKGLLITRAASVIGLLGFNITAGTVATLDALLSFIANVATRRNTGLSDTISAIYIMTKSIPQLIINAGGIKKSKYGYGIINTMLEHFGFDNVLGTIKSSDKNQVRRALLNDGFSGLAFFPFSIGEKFINTITLVSSLNAHRLYRGKFLSREAFFRKANEDGLTRGLAKRLWMKPGNRLYDAYTIDKKGNLVPKTKTKAGLALASMSKESREALENSIRAKNKSKAASFNALVLSSETSQLQTNILFNWISMMRNFLIIGFWERFSKLNDFYEYDSDEMSEGEKEQMRTDQANYSGGINFMTGEITTGRFRGALRLLFSRDNGKHSALGRMFKNWGDLLKYFHKTQIARQDKYDVRKELKLSEADLNGFNMACAELIIIALSMMASGWFHNKYAGDYDDEYWFLLIDLILLRMPIERLTLWNPDTIMELVRSITAGKTFSDRLVFGSILKLAIKDYKEHDFNYSDYERVKDGSFKGETALYRDALKLTSFLGTYNLYRNTHTNALRESKKFYTKLGDFNPASLLWKSKKELEAEKQSQEQFEPADIYGGGFSY